LIFIVEIKPIVPIVGRHDMRRIKIAIEEVLSVLSSFAKDEPYEENEGRETDYAYDTISWLVEETDGIVYIPPTTPPTMAPVSEEFESALVLAEVPVDEGVWVMVTWTTDV